ncbi:carbon starvation protein [Mycobacteroides abscessus subsp. abscessus]|nr:carbon starvation protein [Mycobacteroides abscessus subsp. abscessus]
MVTTIVVKQGLYKWAWIPALPLGWDLIVTMTASWQKLFSTDPAIGYWKQHQLYAAARDAGLTSFKTAKTPEAMDAVIRNTFVQGTLSAIFASLVLVVVAAGAWTCLRAVRAGALRRCRRESVGAMLLTQAR